MALQCLSDVVDAMIYVVLKRWIARSVEYVLIMVDVYSLTKTILIWGVSVA